MAVLRLARWLREDQPNLISTWQYHADLIGGLAARLAGCIPVAWGIRQSDLSREGNGRLTFLTARMCARLSRWLPEKIICCSEAARQVHAALGYAAEKMLVIPNGYDLGTFRPDSLAREAIRKELGIPEDAPVIGLVARFHPQKDHRNFVQAASLLHQDRPDVHFVLCGRGVDWENRQLTTWIEEAGIRSRCHLLGLRDDTPKLTAAFDLACLASFTEGFPNVVSEAMSCEVPCVVTDVGDAALIVGQTGIVVPPRNPAALAAALRKMVDLGREGRNQLGIAARQRIMEQFNLPQIVTRYESLFQELASGTKASFRNSHVVNSGADTMLVPAQSPRRTYPPQRDRLP
jgi:glycosyltransferase involved in cell wall biosynthesis